MEIPVYNVNSVDPDQTPRCATSDLGLHYLAMSLLWQARHKWITRDNVPICLIANKSKDC